MIEFQKDNMTQSSLPIIIRKHVEFLRRGEQTKYKKIDREYSTNYIDITSVEDASKWPKKISVIGLSLALRTMSCLIKILTSLLLFLDLTNQIIHVLGTDKTQFVKTDKML